MTGRRIRFLTALALGLFSLASSAATLSGRVVAISDGDTVTVQDPRSKKHKIRLAGIEAPDSAQPYGDRSKQHLADLVLNQSVSVEWQKYDAYGRKFGKIMVAGRHACPALQPDCPRTLDVGLAQLVAGLAWHYRHTEGEQRPQERAAYSFAEKVARRKHVGLWADTGPVPPWQWRNEHKLVK
jgi:endonuclease YncB( thermonuclease family)